MQKTYAKKVSSLAERIRSGQCKTKSIEELSKEASEFFSIGMVLVDERRYEQAVEYLKAASEDFDFAYNLSKEYELRGKCADNFHLIRFHLHRLNAKIYTDGKRYYKVLEEVNAAKKMRALIEDSAIRDDEVSGLDISSYINYLSRLESIAKAGLLKIPQLSKKQYLQNALYIAVAEERYEDAVVFRDEIKKLEGLERKARIKA